MYLIILSSVLSALSCTTMGFDRIPRNTDWPRPYVFKLAEHISPSQHLKLGSIPFRHSLPSSFHIGSGAYRKIPAAPRTTSNTSVCPWKSLRASTHVRKSGPIHDINSRLARAICKQKVQCSAEDGDGWRRREVIIPHVWRLGEEANGRGIQRARL